MGHKKYFSRKLMWVISYFCTIVDVSGCFVLHVCRCWSNVFIKNLKEDMGSWTHGNATLTGELV